MRTSDAAKTAHEAAATKPGESGNDQTGAQINRANNGDVITDRRRADSKRRAVVPRLTKLATSDRLPPIVEKSSTYSYPHVVIEQILLEAPPSHAK